MEFLVKSKKLHFIFLGLLVVFLSLAIPSDHKMRERLSFIAFDEYYSLYPRPATDRVKIVDIDDFSLSKLGQWPWSRDVMSSLILKLSEMGAKAIAFDGVLAEPDRTSLSRISDKLKQLDVPQSVLESLPDNDVLFAKAIQQSGVFVAGWTHGSNKARPHMAGGVDAFRAPRSVKDALLKQTQKFCGTALFLPEFQKNASGNGSFMAQPESDGILRKSSLVFSDFYCVSGAKKLYPSLSIEAYRVYKDVPMMGIARADRHKAQLKYADYKLDIAGEEIPLDKRGAMWVYFRNMQDDYISAYDVIDPEKYEAVKKQVEGRILFMGSSAEGLKDLRATPLNPFLPGVEIHANLAEQFMQKSYLHRPDVAIIGEASFILFFGGLMILLAPFVNILWAAGVFAGSIVLVIACSLTAFANEGLLLDPIYPGVSVFLIFVASVFLTYLRTEAERKHIRDAFGHYISPDLMEELTNNPDKLKLGGEMRPMSIMFTDIRSFTSISERMSPEELTQLMNDFLTPMSELVMKNRGTIDKYMGDAMMAFWNAPLDDDNHAWNACMTALQMNKALEPINEKLAEKAAQEGQAPIVLEAGIGINTGSASVGNMGSKQRFAYSALGDSVNLASRLEGQTKQYGVRILIGEETRLAAPDFAALELDLIRVKGKQKPERIFVLLGDAQMAQGDYFKNWRADHEEMLKSYRAAEWKKAIKLAEKCKNTAKEGMQAYYDMLISRMEEMKTARPQKDWQKDWDGVFTATSK